MITCLRGLLYACEVWGDVSYIESRLSTLETKLLKRILNVKKGTSNTIIFHELRRANIISNIKDRQFQFFQKIMGFCEHDTVTLDIIRICRRCRILDYYFNLGGKNCDNFLRNVKTKMQYDNTSMIVYYRNLMHHEKSHIYNSSLNDYHTSIIRL